MKAAFVAAMLLVCGSVPSFGADQRAMELALQRDAQNCADALLKRDYWTASGCVHPRELKRYGGREKFSVMLGAAVQQTLKTLGFTVESKTYERPGEIRKTEKFYYAVVRERSVIVGTVESGPARGKRGRFATHGYELGISEDQGRTWKMAALESETVFSSFPELKGKVQVPAFPPPVLLEWLSDNKP